MPNRRPSPPPSVKQYIYDTALIKPWRSARIMSTIVREQLVQSKEIDEEYGIKEETIRKYIEDARKNDPDNEAMHKRKVVSPEGKEDRNEGQSWNLGISNEFDIPWEANEDLMKLWKTSLLTGLPLTIREAKWAARLRNLVRLPRLLKKARAYAIRERACIALGRDIETQDLDATIAFDVGGWGYGAAKAVGLLESSYPVSKEERWALTITSITQEMVEDRGIGKAALWKLVADIATDTDYFGEIRDIIKEASLSDESSEAYAVWLQRLMQGPSWNSMTNYNRKEFALDLLAEIVEGEQHIKFLQNEYVASISTDMPGGSWVKGLAPLNFEEKWRPSPGLLEKVGYTLQDFEPHDSTGGNAR